MASGAHGFVAAVLRTAESCYDAGVRRPTSDITTFLKAPENSVTRERLLFHKLSFDMYCAAARRGYALVVFTPEVDREGYDLVLDDGDNECRIQLKSILASSKAGIWKTRKRFLRPLLRNAEWFGFDLSPEGVGLGGGLVLMECEEDLGITYHYTDLLILAALSHGWIPGKAPVRQQRTAGSPRTPGEQASDIITKLRVGSGEERVDLPIGVFVTAKGIDQLLPLIGLHSSVNTNLRYRLWLRLGKGYQARTHGPLEREIRNDFKVVLQ